MRIINGLNNIGAIPPNTISTIGIFDGVHKGHLSIFKKIISQAKKLKTNSFVITFKPCIAGDNESNLIPSFLISPRHRLLLMERIGIDYCLVINFNSNFAQVSATEFVDDFLFKGLNIKRIYAGEDFHFGKGRRGDARFLKDYARKLGFGVVVVPPLRYKGRVISSSWIRNEIKKGNLKLVKKLLGRPLSIYGKVVKGSGRGRYLGFPTANLNIEHEVIPPTGVYAVRTVAGNIVYKGLLNIGCRPTFVNKRDDCLPPTIEVHLPEFKGNSLYGKFLEVEFVEKIRPEKKFARSSNLVTAIKNDILQSRRIFLKHRI